MSIFSLKNIVSSHNTRERLDVFLAVWLPLVLMLESGYACGWMFAGGVLDWASPTTYFAMIRGLFLEVLIFCMYKLTQVFVAKRVWSVMWIPFLIGTMGMFVSAGFNLGWADRSGDMAQVVTVMGQFMPGVLVEVFKIGLGLLFPLSLGALALFDVHHLVDKVLTSSHLDERALLAEKAELHRNHAREAMKKGVETVRSQYDQIFKDDAQRQVERAKQGDWSFGANEVSSVAAPAPVGPRVVRISPVQPPQPPLVSGPSTGMNGPSIPSGPPMGNGRNNSFPQQPTQQFPSQGPSWGQQYNGR